MQKLLPILSALTLILAGVAVALWLRPARNVPGSSGDMRFGVHEGLELVGLVNSRGKVTYVVNDAEGNRVFSVPVRNCLLDVRFRGGLLRFRENATGREGCIDRTGHITFTNNAKAAPMPAERAAAIDENTPAKAKAGTAERHNAGNATATAGLSDSQLRSMARSNPFYKEAAKVLSGKLDESDGQRRRVILNYCEHLRTAYNTKDIDFLRQVFSDRALIIVGNVVKDAPADGAGGLQPGGRVEYFLRTKKEYISRLSRAFAANSRIDVAFSSFRIMRHPTVDGIYGVSLRQLYKSDSYADDGYLFLLWDFRNPSMPLIHVRTWQPASAVNADEGPINITDFNLE